MFKKLFEKLTGIDKIRHEAEIAIAETRKANEDRLAAEVATAEAKEAERVAKLTPKERATERGEPWVDVLETHVNKENIRNGFFELDWNELFIKELIEAGYGFDEDPEEEIVDRWFRDLAANMLVEGGLDPSSRTAGYINVTKLADGKAQVE